MKKLIILIVITLVSASLFAGIVDYVVVEAKTKEAFRTEVLKYLDKGYKLQGGAFIRTDSYVADYFSSLETYNARTVYCQTLIKED